MSAMIRSTRGRGVLVAAMLLSLVLPGTANAEGTSGRDRLVGRDFPTFAAVADVMPYLRGGSRELLGGYRDPVQVPSADCTAFAGSRTPVHTSRVAVYDRSGESVYTLGQAYPVISVYRYAGRRAAARAFGEVRRAVRRCQGRHEDPGSEGYSTTYRLIAAPRYGSARIAHRRVREDAVTGRDWFAESTVLRGRHLVEVRLQHDTRAPGARPLHALARLALRAVGR